MQSSSPLGEISPDTFLREYWQKKPLVVRQAIDPQYLSLNAQDLFNAAGSDQYLSRLTVEDPEKGIWNADFGPYDPEELINREDKLWTLLVHDMECNHTDVSRLWDYFDFLPRWRLDDIMYSYSPTGGSVGPHFDQHDVFIIQNTGRKRWQLGGWQDGNTPTLSEGATGLMSDFQVMADCDWVMEPGDMIYIPARMAHHGVSLDDNCTSLSIGFRAPDVAEILSSYADMVGERYDWTQRYTDPDLTLPEDPYELDVSAIHRMRQLVLNALDDSSLMTEWLARHMSGLKYRESCPKPNEPLTIQGLQQRFTLPHMVLYRHQEARLLWNRVGVSEGQAVLYANGKSYPTTRQVARWICHSTQFTRETLLGVNGALSLLVELYNDGVMTFDPPNP